MRTIFYTAFIFISFFSAEAQKEKTQIDTAKSNRNFELGIAIALNHNFEEAKEYFLKALKFNSRNTQAYMGLSYCAFMSSALLSIRAVLLLPSSKG
jgi:hypothetical protein